MIRRHDAHALTHPLIIHHRCRLELHCFNPTTKPCHPPSTRRHHHTALHCISVSVAHDTNPIPLPRTYFIILTRPPFPLFFSSLFICLFSPCAMVQRSFVGVYHLCSIIFVFLFCFFGREVGGISIPYCLSWCFGRVSAAAFIVLFGGAGGVFVCLLGGMGGWDGSIDRSTPWALWFLCA
jgi:hypothetical protein